MRDAGNGHWVDPHEAYNRLVDADVKKERIGPLAMFAFSSHFPAGLSFKYNLSVHGQVIRFVPVQTVYTYSYLVF